MGKTKDKDKEKEKDGPYKFGSKKDPEKWPGQVITVTPHYGVNIEKLSDEDKQRYFDSVRAEVPELLAGYQRFLEAKKTAGINLEPALAEYENYYFRPALKDLNIETPKTIGFYKTELSLVDWESKYPIDNWQRVKSIAETACGGLAAIARARIAVEAGKYQEAIQFIANAGHKAVTLRTQIMERDYFRGKEKVEGLKQGGGATDEQKELARVHIQGHINNGHSAKRAYELTSLTLQFQGIDIKASTLKTWDRKKEIIVNNPKKRR